MSIKGSTLHSWQRFKADFDAEQEYIAAERSGIRLDDCSLIRTLKVEHLEGTELNPSGKAIIRLKGKWLYTVFPPGTRVAVEIGDGAIVIKRTD
jgi:hypothetical protein